MIAKNKKGLWNNHAEDRIAIEPYNPGWVFQFAYEQCAMRESVDVSIPLVIEHVGSTAIPGLPAQPVIDILVGASARHWTAIIAALEGLGYVHWKNNPDPQCAFLVKGMPPFGERRTHHAHICSPDSPLWERLLFRDYLREHGDDRKAYADVKQDLALNYPDDRDAYIEGTSIMVAEIMQRARAWQRSR